MNVSTLSGGRRNPSRLPSALRIIIVVLLLSGTLGAKSVILGSEGVFMAIAGPGVTSPDGVGVES